METIPHNDCLKIGYLQKPHGVRGEVVLQFEPEFGASLEKEPVLLLEIDGLLVPYFPEEQGIRFRTDVTALLKFSWVESELQAKEICGCQVYMKKADRIEEQGEDSLHDLIGFKLIDKKIGIIGRIENVEDYGGNLVIQLTWEGKEILIPFNEDFLIRFDDRKREIEMECPEGIFDLN
ncbi:MAG: ribosome maturation factor RimM [Prolixibacteraceae bacterium]